MITLMCTVEVERIGWLPHFVHHYRTTGVERFLITLHVDEFASDSQARQATLAAKRVLDRVGVTLRRTIVGPFSAMAARANHDDLQATHCSANDWIVWCDIDELQGYPEPLPELCAAWDAAAINIVPGVFVDRITADGSLADFDPALPIWEQFPLGCDMTARVLAGSNRKVACSKGHLKIARANHTPLAGQDLCSASSPIDIHHFKWDSTVVRRLSRRLEESWRKRCPWWLESHRAIEHIKRHGGRIGVDELTTIQPSEPFYRITCSSVQR